MEVYNSSVLALRDGIPVIVGRVLEEPHYLQILSVHSGAASTFSTPNVISDHADAHRLVAPDGGIDPVFIEKEQLLPGRLIRVCNALVVRLFPSCAA